LNKHCLIVPLLRGAVEGSGSTHPGTVLTQINWRPLMAPKVFVSHASEDKERFVIPFATALRAKGIDAWLDRWEMLPGDSLVDKIFEEGLKEAEAVVVVLSDASVQKPWVRDELNTAVVARIDRGAKLIPIVLDQCEVPAALRSLVWENVPDTSDFSNCLARVVDAVFNHTSKPPIGRAPSYVSSAAMPTVPGLSSADMMVLKALYEFFIVSEGSHLAPNVLVDQMARAGIDASMVSESLEALDYQGYVELLKHIGPGPYNARISTLGVSVILGEPRESELMKAVGLSIVNSKHEQSSDIASEIGESEALVNHCVDRLEARGFIKVARSIGGTVHIHTVSPMLRRALNG
jgi:DNA-binding MarR family transcriptional regulator